MDIATLRDFCLSLPAVEEATPFDETTLVYKVGGKMFALCNMVQGVWVNLKCDPDRAIELREEYAEVEPGFHMNKRHWNTVRLDGSLPRRQIEEWICDSYRLVAHSLPRKLKDELPTEVFEV